MKNEQTSSLQKNLIFVNKEIFDELETLNNAQKYIPQFVKTSFNFEKTGQFVKDCVTNGFEYGFLKTLKEKILGTR